MTKFGDIRQAFATDDSFFGGRSWKPGPIFCFSVFGARIVMRNFTSTKMRVFWKAKCLLPLCILLIKTLASRFLPMIIDGYHENHLINKWIQFLCLVTPLAAGFYWNWVYLSSTSLSSLFQESQSHEILPQFARKRRRTRGEREKERRKQGGKIFKKSHKGILSGKLTDRSTCLPIPDAVLSFRSLNSFLELYNNLDND